MEIYYSVPMTKGLVMHIPMLYEKCEDADGKRVITDGNTGKVLASGEKAWKKYCKRLIKSLRF